MADFADIAQAYDIRHGTVRAMRRGDALSLTFSSDIPTEAHQRFRNVLGVHQHRVSGR